MRRAVVGEYTIRPRADAAPQALSEVMSSSGVAGGGVADAGDCADGEGRFRMRSCGWSAAGGGGSVVVVLEPERISSGMGALLFLGARG